MEIMKISKWNKSFELACPASVPVPVVCKQKDSGSTLSTPETKFFVNYSVTYIPIGAIVAELRYIPADPYGAPIYEEGISFIFPGRLLNDVELDVELPSGIVLTDLTCIPNSDDVIMSLSKLIPDISDYKEEIAENANFKSTLDAFALLNKCVKGKEDSCD